MLGFTSTFNSPAYAGYLPHLAVAKAATSWCAYRENFVFAVPSDELRRGQFHHPYAPAVCAQSRKPCGAKPRRASRVSPVFVSKMGSGSISPVLKLWGLTAGGGITFGTNAPPQGGRTARCPLLPRLRVKNGGVRCSKLLQFRPNS